MSVGSTVGGRVGRLFLLQCIWRDTARTGEHLTVGKMLVRSVGSRFDLPHDTEQNFLRDARETSRNDQHEHQHTEKHVKPQVVCPAIVR